MKLCKKCKRKLNVTGFWPNWTICKNCYEVENFNEYGNNYKAWECQSTDLWVSADCLKAARFNQNGGPTAFCGTYTLIVATELMLRGFSFECLFKAIWLKKGNFLVINGKMDMPKEFRNHELNKMSEKLEFIFTNQEKFFLDILTNYSRNLGRYPIGIEIKKKSKLNNKEVKEPQYAIFNTKNDYTILNKIRRKLLDKL